MLQRHDAVPGTRSLNIRRLAADLCVVGGGLAGACCAIMAARHGLKTVLIHDRPVLGGNASSEIRLWVLGATCHMGSNNRWAREGGLVDEILTETLWRNPECNPLIFDLVLLGKARAEPNLTLLLDTAMHDCWKSASDRIAGVRAFCPQDGTSYEVTAPLFADASGDGILGFLAGAAFRLGAEGRDEFGEGFAPAEEYGSLLGQSMYFYSKDTGRPVRFTAPDFALRDITAIPRWRHFNARDDGCRLWWIEWGGRLDPVHDGQAVKWELWKVVYGVWDHIKNSGRFPEAANLTLEWVSHIPGKRESRRFEGDCILTQRDVIGMRRHEDEVAFGGWAIDLHPADGVYSPHDGCTHLRAKGIYGIPWRCLYSRNIANLFLCGRLISVSHVAFGSTRVMGTLATCGQAVAAGAAICIRRGAGPRDLAGGPALAELQRGLLRDGQHLIHTPYRDPDDAARHAIVSASSRLLLAELPADGPAQPLDRAWAELLPLPAGAVPRCSVTVDAVRPTTLVAELRICSRRGHHTPDTLLARREIALQAGDGQRIALDLPCRLAEEQYAFLCLLANPDLRAHTSRSLASGLLAVRHHHDQAPPPEQGVESFAWWSPVRRPGPQNLAVRCEPPLDRWGPASIQSGWTRPAIAPNCWVADPADPRPELLLHWPRPETIAAIDLFFDPDWEHPMEHVLFQHPERVVPYLVRDADLLDDQGRIVAEVRGNHLGLVRLRLAAPLSTRRLILRVLAMNGPAPAAVFAVRCWRAAGMGGEPDPTCHP